MALSDLIHSDDDRLPTKALVIVAHPDDIDFGVAGTVATFTDHGVEVVYALVTSGQAGEPADLTPAELTEIRQAEQTAAAKVVGVTELHWLGFPDGAIEASLELRKALSRVIRIVKPDLVITHTPVRNWDRIYSAHPDHLATGEAVTAAVYPDSRNGHSFPDLLKEGHAPHSVPRLWLMAGTDNTVYVDISANIERKIEALLEHHSQNDDRAEALPALIRDWSATSAAEAGFGASAVEGFRLVHTE